MTQSRWNVIKVRRRQLFDGISDWLAITLNRTNDRRYEHILLQEVSGARAQVLDALVAAVAQVHEDAKQHLRSLARTSLDPMGAEPTIDPADGYPGRLPMNTLKGYFGEFFAGLLAESFEISGECDWRVPAYLFRFHQTAFDELDRVRQTGAEAREVFGRTGDDCLAFRSDEGGNVTHCLLCEAKCTADHNPTMISEAHNNLNNNQYPKPVAIRQVIEILDGRNDADSRNWSLALRRFWLSQPQPGYERRDMVCYVCGRRPQRTPSWMPSSNPHNTYTASRRLTAAEVHLEDLDDLIRELYNHKN